VVKGRVLKYWLVKSEPSKYSWDDFVSDGRTYWDGVRNAQARNNLAAMRCGDQVLFYHSNQGRQVVGIARVVAEAYPDPTTEDERWVVVDLEPVKALEEPVPLADIKGDAELEDCALVRQSRLSVLPLTRRQFTNIVARGKARRG